MPIITGGKVIEGAYVRPASSAYSSTAGSIGPFESAGVPASGYLNGEAKKGALCADTTNGKLYVNTGTLAATVWAVAGTQT